MNLSFYDFVRIWEIFPFHFHSMAKIHWSFLRKDNFSWKMDTPIFFCRNLATTVRTFGGNFSAGLPNNLRKITLLTNLETLLTLLNLVTLLNSPTSPTLPTSPTSLTPPTSPTRQPYIPRQPYQPHQPRQPTYLFSLERDYFRATSFWIWTQLATIG